MKKTYILAALTALSSFAYGQQIKSYDLNVDIDVKSKIIKVKGIIAIDFEQKESIATVLWKNTKINEISVNGAPLTYRFESNKPTPIIFIDEGRGLIFNNPSKKKGRISVYVNYESDFTGMEASAEAFTDEWLQIGFYNAWFPVDINSRKATSKLSISIDPTYKVSGSGKITKKGELWEMNQPWAAYDNVIIAAKNLKSNQAKKDNTVIESIYTDFPEADIASIIETSQTVLNYFGKIYPKQDEAYIKFVVKHSANGGGGYNRANFISLRIKSYGLSTQKTIAHEVAHFWATGADATSWQDWLNESFAEYSALLYVRDSISTTTYNDYIKAYKKSILNAPAIWDFDRSSNAAYTVLYKKGAVILHDLESKIGTTQMFNLLKLKRTQGIKNTADFLDLLEQQTSKETRNWLENALKS